MTSQSLKSIFVTFLMFFSSSLFAQTPEEIINEIAENIQYKTGLNKELEFYKSLKQLEPLKGQIEGLGLYVMTYHKIYSSKGSIMGFRNALSKLEKYEDATPEELNAVVDEILIAAFRSANAGTVSPEYFKRIGKLLESINDLGGTWEDYVKLKYDAEGLPFLSFLDKLLKASKATETIEEMREKGKADAEKLLSNIVGLIPASAAPALVGPTGVFFTDLMEYEQKFWETSTQGLELIPDAIENGRVDQKKLKEITDKLNKLANEGPWTGQSGLDFINKVVEGIPLLGKLFKAFKSFWIPKACRPINCDCPALVDWGILAGAYIKECKSVEVSLKEQCNKTGKVEGVCHQVAAGPLAFPKSN